MDLKQVNPVPEGMPLNPDANRVPPAMSASVDPSATVQITQVHLDNYSPPILHYNIHLPPDQPSISGICDRGAPPSYEEAIDPNAPPPSYESLFGRMRAAHKSRKGTFDFLQNILVLLLGTIGCTIILGITFVLPICMMIIGGLYLYDCPQGEYIPVYLLVGGGFTVFKQLLHFCSGIRQRRGIQDEETIRQSSTETLINCFILGWFIIGSMWVYKEYEPNYDPTLGKYCNKTLYLFAFWLITSTYICLALAIVCICITSLTSVLLE